MSGRFAIRGIGYVVAVNLLAYAAMVFDKARAESNSRCIPESTLLNLAVIGGSIGTVIAPQTIRHKTRKEPFRSQVAGMVLLQVLALIAGLVITGSPEMLWQFTILRWLRTLAVVTVAPRRSILGQPAKNPPRDA